MDKYDALKIENQLCFPIYAASREITKKYRPFLEALDLTYTQYIVMMVIWDEKKISAKDLGARLYLDSGTLTPVLKSLESKGYIKRNRSKEDERVLIAELSSAGQKLKAKAVIVPHLIGDCISLEPDEAEMMYKLLYKILNGFDNE